MARVRTHYICRSCGSVQVQWMGKCPDCGAWDSLEKFTESKITNTAHSSLAEAWTGSSAGASAASGEATALASGSAAGAATVPTSAQATPLPEIESADIAKLPTGIGELDRVLGGGLVNGSVVLLGGDPGIGKSTLMLQAAGRLAQHDKRVLYVTSEESAYQTRLRAERLFEHDGIAFSTTRNDGRAGIERLDELFVLADTNLARIFEQARKVQPQVMVIDSIQMVYKPDLDASPGSVTQLRRTCTELVYLAKVSGMAIVLVGHVTKDGQLAGPKLLEHLVDAVLSFEGDRHHSHRVVRGIKNRFGTTLEVGLFEMTGDGLVEIADLAALLDPKARPNAGSVICPAMHGTRCLLVEIQALTATGFLGAAKRKASGVDPNRLAMLIAVLEKHGGLRLADQDVFASAVGGLKVIEPGADLALALAIAGAFRAKPMPAGTAAVGEIGLGGEIRHVHQIDQRIREAQRRGYGRIIVPADGPKPSGSPTSGQKKSGAAELIRVRTIGEALESLS